MYVYLHSKQNSKQLIMDKIIIKKYNNIHVYMTKVHNIYIENFNVHLRPSKDY